jgi:hypothetical protein
MSGEEDLPPELRSLEAALASLAPRRDRLDRDRLLFLAGQESVRTKAIAAAPRAWRLAWPAAFSGMTAVAAALLVLLLARPQPGAVERIVYVPAAQPKAAEPAAKPAVPETQPAPREAAGPSPLVAWLEGDRDRSPLRRAPYFQALDEALHQGMRPAPRPAPAGLQEGRRQIGPLSYREMLDSLLEESGAGGRLPGGT